MNLQEASRLVVLNEALKKRDWRVFYTSKETNGSTMTVSATTPKAAERELKKSVKDAKITKVEKG